MFVHLYLIIIYYYSVVDCEVMGWTLDRILTKFAVGTSPLVLQASCVWLLTILKLAGKHPDIQVSSVLLFNAYYLDAICIIILI